MTKSAQKNYWLSAFLKKILCTVPAIRNVFLERDNLRYELRRSGVDRISQDARRNFLAMLASEYINDLEQTVDIAPLNVPNFYGPMLNLYVYDDESMDRYISVCIKKYGIWEPSETQFLLNRLQFGDIFLDIGANIGYYSVLAASLVGDTGRVVAFEPEPSNFALLSANRMINAVSNLTLVNAAVSNSIGSQELFISSNNRGDNRLGFGDENAASVPVATVTLDNSIPPRNADQRLVVKIDTQGWEAAIIFGNIDTLQTATIIIFEWSPAWITRNGHDPMKLLEEIERRGFTISRIVEGIGQLDQFSSKEARIVLPQLMRASGAAGDPSFYDLVAEKI